MDQKLGALAPFWGRGAGSPCNTMSLGLRPTYLPSGVLIRLAIWPQQIWAKNWKGLCPFGEGELGLHLTQCGQGRGLPAWQVSSWSILPFGHNTPMLQTERQTDRTGQQSDSIGRTVLQTVTQKLQAK